MSLARLQSWVRAEAAFLAQPERAASPVANPQWRNGVLCLCLLAAGGTLLALAAWMISGKAAFALVQGGVPPTMQWLTAASLCVLSLLAWLLQTMQRQDRAPAARIGLSLAGLVVLVAVGQIFLGHAGVTMLAAGEGDGTAALCALLALAAFAAWRGAPLLADFLAAFAGAMAYAALLARALGGSGPAALTWIPPHTACIAFILAIAIGLCDRTGFVAQLWRRASNGRYLISLGFPLIYGMPLAMAWLLGQGALANGERAWLVVLLLTLLTFFLAATKLFAAVHIYRSESGMRDLLHQAEALARAKSDFLANMSHEIRTPLNAILGLTRLFRVNTPLTPKQTHYVDKIERASDLLLNIINDILDFSRLESGNVVLEQRAFALDAVLAGLHDMFLARAEEKGLHLKLEMAGDVPERLLGDDLRLAQVLINLIGNAIKFTERGEIELTVHCVQQTPADVVLAFAVRDSGIGISPTAQAHLFESFFQEDSSTTRRFGGSGLGLAICKRLVGLMQGRIWVDSTPGEGSTFHFTARFGRVPQLESATHHPRVSRHVLVVDDDRISRLLLVRLLHKMGHTTEEAGSGHEALARARRGRFDVLLLDWRMPDLDGLQVAAHLQANWPKTPHAPHLPAIVLVSGADEADVSQEARVAGIELAAYIAKPVTAEVLRQTFVRIFDQPLAEPQVNPVRERLRRGLRILLVEDNPLNQDVMRESLSAIAAEVTLAEHGQAALARLERQAFDLVLMDVQMPVMDGLDATRAIRARPEWAKLPIIGLTANALPGDREVCLAAGMNDYLPKPIEFDALLATIARWQPVVQSCPADHPDTHAGVPASGESPPSATVATAGRLGAAQRSSEDDLRAALQEIAELDSGPALERVRGQVTRYVEFLAQFLKQGSAVLDALEAAAAAGERTVVQRQAHSLKGSAGMIGARRLQAAAADLENLLRQDPQADFGLPLAAVRKAWQDLNAALRPILP